MRRRQVHLPTLFCLSAIAGIAACTNSDPRCSLANCEEMFSCGAFIFGVPEEPRLCKPDPARPLATYCVQSCQQHDQGELVGCIADNFGHSCPEPDGGFASTADLESTCAPAGLQCGSTCQSCVESCETTLEGCDRTCPDAGSCLDCEYQCSIADGTCENACPRD